MHFQIGQDGGKRATYPGYSVGSFMAKKHRIATGLGGGLPEVGQRVGRKRVMPIGLAGKCSRRAGEMAGKCQQTVFVRIKYGTLFRQ
jgi:hypothetical protein